MSTELQTVDQSKLVTLARGLALRGLRDPLVLAGIAAAEALKGIVVTDDATEASVADLLGQVLKGKRALKAASDEVLALPKAMTSAVRDAVMPEAARLEMGEKAGKDAVGRYLDQKRRAADAERQRLEKEQREAAAAHAQEVAEDPDAPPPMVAGPAPVFKPQVRGGSTMLHETKVLKVALVDVAECPPDWLKLDEARAKEAFRDVLRRGTVTEPGDVSQPVTFAGCQFFYERTVSARADFRR